MSGDSRLDGGSGLGREIGKLPDGRPDLHSFLERGRRFFGPAEEIAELEQELERANKEIVRLKNKLAEQIRQTHVDSLTDLLSRQGVKEVLKNRVGILSKRLATERRQKDFVAAVLFIDLDNFKLVNDTTGSHERGDALLKSFAEKMRVTFYDTFKRETDILGRLHGDEFVIVSLYTTPGETQKIAEKFREKIEQDAQFTFPHFSVTVSIGVVEIPISSGSDIESIIESALSLADGQMYNSKRTGGNCVTVYKKS